MYKDLTEKQKRFVDEYIISFNATQAAKNAGYSQKSAKQIGTENLAKPSIIEAIKERVAEAKDTAKDRIQDVQETLEQDTSIARADIQVTEFKETDLLTGEVIQHTKREYVPSLEEQGRARERIYKVNGAYTEKREINAKISTDPIQEMLNELKGGSDD